jgi:ATP-dependent DNA helicase RecQ
MKGSGRKALANMVYQLLDNGLLERTSDERPVLKLNEASWEVLRGRRAVRLLQPKMKVEKARFGADSWAGVEPGLFESLRNLRRDIAHERGVPAYVLFSDATLRDMARLRPRSPAALLSVHGVGERKLSDFGQRFLERIALYCRENELPQDISVTANASRDRAR